MVAGSLTYDTKVDTGGIKKGLGKVGSIAGTAAKATGAAIAATAAGVTALVAQSVKEYGKIEQSIGGVKKLYQDAYEDVLNNAKQAYRTSGLSANEYMEQATSFSASLIKSLNGDTKKAAELTDVAMRDMSDNVNTFGTNASAVQSAYQRIC